MEDGFKIENLEQASWAFRKLSELYDKQTEIEGLANAEIKRINLWRESESKGIQDSVAYFKGLLIEYYKRTGQKVSTPYGKLGARKTKKWIYTDEEKLIECLKHDYGQLIRVKEEINKEELRKVFKDGVNKETGEILPYVKIQEEETISIKVEG